AEATLLTPRLVEPRRARTAVFPVARLRGHSALANSGVVGRRIRSRRARLRRRRLDDLRLRHLVLAHVPLPGIYRLAVHAPRAGCRNRHRLARTQRTPDIRRTTRIPC